MRLNLPIAAGLLAPILYAASLAVLGNLTPGYDHVADAIGELNRPGAPYRRAFDSVFILYSLLLILFALSLRRQFAAIGARAAPLSVLLLFLTGLFGVAVTGLFRLDPAGSEPTFGGQMHRILGGVLAVLPIFVVLAFAAGLRRQGVWRRLAGYSSLTFAVILASAAFAAIAAARRSPVLGIWERISVAAFLQWIFLLALILAVARRPREIEEEPDDEDA